MGIKAYYIVRFVLKSFVKKHGKKQETKMTNCQFLSPATKTAEKTLESKLVGYCELGIGNDGENFSCIHMPCNTCGHYKLDCPICAKRKVGG